MSARICRTPDDAFQAGFTEPCEHGITPEECPRCRLTEAEIGRLVALLRGELHADGPQATAA
ncbi:hypothetical protein [Streptomyces sp. bgisy154]|uniref:hypothetical protein n=1 Tax=Streptomyces sp. bgisy154 TaxID=3413794 RepID=UPI003D714296